MNEPSQHSFESLPPKTRDLFASLCRDFENQWTADETSRPKLESFIAEADPEFLDHLKSLLVALEIELRVQDGEMIRSADYESRFPDLNLDNTLSLAGSESISEISQISFSEPRHEGVTRTDIQESGNLSARKQALPDDVPKQIGRHKVQKTIGIGEFGVICLARDTQLNRDVAL